MSNFVRVLFCSLTGETRSLDGWHKSKQQWNRISRNIASKIGKVI
jgi:hypothetical protein